MIDMPLLLEWCYHGMPFMNRNNTRDTMVVFRDHALGQPEGARRCDTAMDVSRIQTSSSCRAYAGIRTGSSFGQGICGTTTLSAKA
jgi:hypothetical protein